MSFEDKLRARAAEADYEKIRDEELAQARAWVDQLGMLRDFEQPELDRKPGWLDTRADKRSYKRKQLELKSFLETPLSVPLLAKQLPKEWMRIWVEALPHLFKSSDYLGGWEERRYLRFTDPIAGRPLLVPRNSYDLKPSNRHVTELISQGLVDKENLDVGPFKTIDLSIHSPYDSPADRSFSHLIITAEGLAIIRDFSQKQKPDKYLPEYLPDLAYRRCDEMPKAWVLKDDLRLGTRRINFEKELLDMVTNVAGS